MLYAEPTTRKYEMARLTDINKVNWYQVGSVTKPGRYQYTFGWLTVATDDLSIWEQHPKAVFTLVGVPAAEDCPGEEFRLGTFELR